MKFLQHLLLGATITVTAQSGLSLVPGGQFKDRILPMQGSVTLETLQETNPSATIWGASGVQNRYVDNGIEVNGMNIWGGNVYKDSEGVYHQFVAAWDGVSRPFSYWANSDIYDFKSSTPYGPFSNGVKIGRGHNPEIFQAKDGSFVVYALIGNRSCWRHTSQSINGPWVFEEMPFDLRDRALSTGSVTTYSNWTFARRNDGSQYCMDRGGAVWISPDGLEAFAQVLGKSCYPNGGGGTFEDPVVWRDEIQYHMIVNDWNARKAYYSRSADGFHWVAEDGLAYDIEISVHPDGTREEWHKYERPKVYQDQYGRAIQLNMAVIDIDKAQDLANDNHSSKNIAMPLNPGLRLFVLNETPISTATEEIRVKVMAEEGFSPTTDLDLESLRFGDFRTVGNGGGAQVTASSADEEGNLVLIFNGSNTGLKADEFAPKMIGRYTEGYELNTESGTQLHPTFCYGYARLPYYNYTPAYLSPILPEIGEGSELTKLRIDNYGLSASAEGVNVKVTTASGTVLATGAVPVTDPYSSAYISLSSIKAIPAGQSSLNVDIYQGERKTDSHTLLLSGINALQAQLSAKYNEALQLYNNEDFVNGREAMSDALESAVVALGSYYEPEITEAIEKLQAAITAFLEANPGVANVSCRNYYLKATNIASGNMYACVNADGSLARKNSMDQSSVFTLIIDGDHDRVYLYNPSSKTFVQAKAGSGQSFWTASPSNAYCLAKVESSTTTADAYTIKGDPTSTNTYNYLNAYGGANHTELSSYTQADKNSQWTLIPADDQTYTFDVTDITNNLATFLETAKLIKNVTIIPGQVSIGSVTIDGSIENTPIYNLSGQQIPASDYDNVKNQIIIQNGQKILKK